MRTTAIALLLCTVLAADAAGIAEIGANDFRISDMGPDGDPSFSAFRPAVAYNPDAREYLVAWHSDDDRDGQVDGEQEIFVQRIDADTGLPLGPNDRRISAMGGLGDTLGRAFAPAVAHNPDTDEYLVVWYARLGGVNAGIFGQRLDAATGAPIGADDFAIAAVPAGRRAAFPAVVYNPTQREYLVVWQSDALPSSAKGEWEIVGRRVDGATGAPLGDPQRLSAMGPDGDPSFDAEEADLAFDPLHNRYLVVWAANDDTQTVGDKTEIYGQLVDGVTGQPTGFPSRVSRTGDDDNPLQGARNPDVAFDPEAGNGGGEYLVVFESDREPSLDENYQIYGQRIGPILGLRIDFHDRPITGLGATFDIFESSEPAVATRPGGAGYLVVWHGEHATLAHDEHEIFGRFLGQDLEPESARLRLSDAGGTGDDDFTVYGTSVAAGPNGEHLVIWQGRDDVAPLHPAEQEIFGQRLDASLFADGFESGDLSAWSAAAP